MSFKSIIRNMALLLTPLVLAGCISLEERSVVVDITSLAPASIDNESTTGRIIVHRNRDFEGLLGGAFEPFVKIDGQIVGACIKRAMLVIELAPGIHTVSSKSESDNERIFEIEAGETAYVRCDYTVGIIVPNINLTFETAAEGEEITAGMRLQ